MSNSVFGLRLSESEHAYLDGIASQTDGILSKAGVLRVLVRHAQASGWDPLDASGTLGLAEATKASPSSSYSSSNKKNTKKEINKCLEQHEELIREFWAVKGGSKGDTAWKLLMTELTKLQDKHGDAVVTEQLHLAINGKWQGISAARYEQFKAPKGGAPAQPEFKHPAAREFRNGRFVDEPVTNPILKDLF